MSERRSEAAFDTLIEAHLIDSGYERIRREGFDRERAILPATVLAFIREPQPKEWTKLEALHGDKTGDQILGDLCKWMDQNGARATLRHGFQCDGRTLQDRSRPAQGHHRSGVEPALHCQTLPERKGERRRFVAPVGPSPTPR